MHALSSFAEFVVVVINVVVVFVVVVDALVPHNTTVVCPFPHWPPVIPPIFGILISILMIPCYCYSCGPWSGPYWAEERRKLIMEESSYYDEQPDPRPTTVNFSGGPRRRAMTNGYGRF